MLNRGYRNHRKYLVARIDVLRHEVKHGGHAARVQAHLILARLLDELDDIDAAAAERKGAPC